MKKIQVLPESIANKIAAGEVIERPASVVKELIENAIDAGATQIITEVREAGKKLIRVIDNGSGMSREDAQLAFERHATSKISSDDDLFSIHTLGFRGEALPSIAAVSRLEMVTRTADALSGTKLNFEGGKLLSITDYGSPVGTNISVRDLFYNTPARLKFMKTDYTEISHITSVVTHLSLAYPAISFRLMIDGKESFYTNPGSDLFHRVVTVMGKETEKELIPLEHTGELAQLQGYISRPHFSRNNWFNFLVFVNGRYITNRIVTNAVYEGYRGMLMVGRYPVGTLFLKMDASEVDVNVHPTKREVRFTHEKQLHETILMAVRSVLHSATVIPQIRVETPVIKEAPSTPATAPNVPVTQAFQRVDFAQRVQQALQAKETSTPVAEPQVVVQDFLEEQIPSSPSSPTVPEFTTKPTSSPKRKKISCAADSSEPVNNMNIPSVNTLPTEFPELEPLAQLDQTYIICRHGNNLMIIDQHAAHERILFDRLLPKMQGESPQVQHLLLPVQVDVSPRESLLLQEYLDDIRAMGLDIDFMGGNTFVIRAVPQIMESSDYREVLLDLVDAFSQMNQRLPTDELRYQMAAVMACRAAIKAGDTQNQTEWQTLVKELRQTQHPFTCPHGRPTLIQLTKNELEKRFKRTGP